MNSEGIDIYGYRSMRVSAVGVPSAKRIIRNAREADELERNGYTVRRNQHPNGAYMAVIGNTHKPHEITVGEIFAENGFSFTLDMEGNAKITMPGGRKFTLPSHDGHVEGFTHEIYALKGKPSAQKVASGIRHSYKPIVFQGNRGIQADVAITYTPKGSAYHREHIDAGAAEFRRQRENSETRAKPILYLHVDEQNRAIYYRSI